MKSNLLSSPINREVVALAAVALLHISAFAANAQTPATSPVQQTPVATTPASPAGQIATPAQAQAPVMEDIRDIRGPKAVPSSEALVLEMLAAGALIALACAAWYFYRRSRLAAKLPYEIALARLEKARSLMQPDLAREFSIEVSEVIRSYTEVRFRVLATHRTTEEFLHDLLEPSDALLASHRALLGDFLHHCDLAKFARWELSVQEMNSMLVSASTYVTQTGKPAPAAATKPSAATATPTSTTQA